MRNILTLLILLCALQTNYIYSQSCCQKSDKKSFADLGDDAEFSKSHMKPLPFSYVSEKGKMVSFKTAGGADAHAFELKTEKKTDKFLFVFHEWWGLNDYVKKESERLYKELGVNVIAIDLYDGKVAADQDEAGKLMKSVTKERAEAIINGALEYAGPDAKIATLGWCFGGGWSLQAAIIMGEKCQGCVMYYGMPETDVSRLKMLQTDVLGIFAEKDKWLNAEVVNTFKENMKAANKNLVIKTFNANHAFANPSSPKFDNAASREANKLALEFLKKKLNSGK